MELRLDGIGIRLQSRRGREQLKVDLVPGRVRWSGSKWSEVDWSELGWTAVGRNEQGWDK